METTIEEIRQSIDDQLKKLEDDTSLASASDFIMEQRWEARNTRLGLVIVFTSAIVAAIGASASVGEFQQYQDFQRFIPLASTLLASIATVVGSILTFLKPSERGSRYREFGNKQKALRNRIRIYRTVLMSQDPSLERLSDQLVAFGQEKDAMNSDNPPVPRSAFRSATKEMVWWQGQRGGLARP